MKIVNYVKSIFIKSAKNQNSARVNPFLQSCLSDSFERSQKTPEADNSIEKYDIMPADEVKRLPREKQIKLCKEIAPSYCESWFSGLSDRKLASLALLANNRKIISLFEDKIFSLFDLGIYDKKLSDESFEIFADIMRNKGILSLMQSGKLDVSKIIVTGNGYDEKEFKKSVRWFKNEDIQKLLQSGVPCFDTGMHHLVKLSENRSLLAAKVLNSDEILSGIINKDINVYRDIYSPLCDISEGFARKIASDKNALEEFGEACLDEDRYQDFMLKYSNCTDKQLNLVQKLRDEGYRIGIKCLQDENEALCVVEAKKGDYNAEYFCSGSLDKDMDFQTLISIQYTFYPDGTIKISRNGITKVPENVSGRIKGSNTEYYQNYLLKNNSRKLLNHIELICDDSGPKEAIVTTASDIISGAYEVYRYKLSDIPEDVDIISAINDGSIEKFKNKAEKLAGAEIMPDGRKVFKENFKNSDTSIQRYYSIKPANNGDLQSFDYHYQINGINGEKLFELNRAFRKNADSSTTTIINGKEYNVFFDDKNMTYKIIMPDGTSKEFYMEDKLNWRDSKRKINDDESISKFWNFLRDVPADILISIGEDIRNIDLILDDSENSSIKAACGILTTGDSLPALSHEMGHMFSYKKSDIFENNVELNEIYKEEATAFSKNHPECEEEIIEYFSQTGGSGFNTGLDELVAEAMVLFTTFNHESALSSRAFYLVRYFPKTIACIGNLLGYNS